VPLAIFGPVGYGLRSGILGAPARATQAASPLLFGLLMDQMGVGVLSVSAGLSLSAFFALLPGSGWRHEDIVFLVDRGPGSLLTPCWRKTDSNPRSLSRECHLILAEEKELRVDQVV